MAVNKEWKCMAHGFFEGTEPLCPHGCDTVERAYLTPQSIATGGKGKFIDGTLQALADDYGFSNMSNRGGDSVIHNAARQGQMDFSPVWKSMPKDGNVAQVLKDSGVRGDTTDGALGQGQFRAPRAVVDERMKYMDSSVLKGALAEGQKANQS